MKKDKIKDIAAQAEIQDEKGVSRRGFLKCSAFLGGSLLFASQMEWALGMVRKAEAGTLSAAEMYDLGKAEHIIYGACLQCHTACNIKGKILNGVLVKIDGNPYSAMTMSPHLPYLTGPKEAAKVDGHLCPKGQAGIQSLYDPYRIVKVLKRYGKRGENKWQVVSFDQAVSEIVNGGKLFKHVPGEENRVVKGLKDIYALRDSKVAKAMAKDAAAVGKQKMTVAAFKKKYARYLDTLIDPDHPDLGPKNNRFVIQNGRIEHGRKEFSKRWQKDSFGSVNWYEHTSICEQSHHIGYNEFTRKWDKGKWGKGKHHMKPDIYNSKYILYFGTGAFEANFGPTNLARKVTQGIADGTLKIAVADPRFSKTAAKAEQWLPLKPGTDAALAYGMIRWIIDNKRYDKQYLSCANKAAANAVKETTWSNASHLVKIEKDGPGALLRASDVGLGSKEEFVAMVGGKPVAVDVHKGKAIYGDLEFDGKVKGIRVKSAFTLLTEMARSKSVAQWGVVCGIAEADIARAAKDFTSYGKQAVAELYRGPVQHTNGFYNARAVIALNVLIGNADWKGGLQAGGGHWHEDGSKNGPYNIKKLYADKMKSFGVTLTREKHKYEDSTLFSGYPAKRCWYPFSGNVYQEIIPSAAMGYPYTIDALMIHKGSPALTTPGANKNIEILQDLNKIPLLFASDIVIGETSMYADYIFPDTAIWERWGTPHATPDLLTAVSKVRQPMVQAMTEEVEVFGVKQPLGMETLLLAIAEKLGLPNHGRDGFGKGQPLERADDWFVRMAANLAKGDKPGTEVPAAGREEQAIFSKARKHLHGYAYDPKRWRKFLGDDMFLRTITVLNRGGRFEDAEHAYKGDKVHHQFKNQFNIYSEKVALARHPGTGKRFNGLPISEPVLDFHGREVKDAGYDMTLITYKDIVGGQSRTIGNYWAQGRELAENYILLNSRDARKLGLKDGSEAKILSASNPDGMWNIGHGLDRPVGGKVKVIEGVRPGVVAVSWSCGHWAYGANDVKVDGKVVKGDQRRGKGLCPNAAMRIDPALGDMCLTDPIGASSAFFGTRVKVVPV
ncbi:molybdopterin-dependent oxidoreductase [Geothermobacter hydrogeniphilus]|uniref:Molybdopterin oxidoreductase n=1 Tax=Geothermobacter hydrogeniphilus TaxID=1969733 RepID=A0A1X0Y2K1_9BACT|nr:molybdopterin-dependent oxidoreductase [Geothermobacter hydrogeniphilus]ORJ59328.1 molybdopterin oxidoreductase [Geothermobacter hydrogeniphilus]